MKKSAPKRKRKLKRADESGIQRDPVNTHEEAVKLTSEETGHPEHIVRSVVELEEANYGGCKRIANKVSKEENYRLTKDGEIKIWKIYQDCAKITEVTDEELENARAEVDKAISQRDRFRELWKSKIEKEELEEERLDYEARLDPLKLQDYFSKAFSKQKPDLHEEFIEASKSLKEDPEMQLFYLGVGHPFERCRKYHGVDDTRQYLEAHLPNIIARMKEEAAKKERERKLRLREKLKSKYQLKSITLVCPDCSTGLTYSQIFGSTTDFYCPKRHNYYHFPCIACEGSFGAENPMKFSWKTSMLSCEVCGLQQKAELPNVEPSTNSISQNAHS